MISNPKVTTFQSAIGIQSQYAGYCFAVIIHPLIDYSWACMLCCLTIVCVLFVYFRSGKQRIRRKTDLENNEIKIKVTETNDNTKLYYSNIIKEFSIPLTIIIAQLELLLRNHSIPPLVHNKLLRIYRNTNIMYNLIHDIPNHSKSGYEYIKLKVKEQDIVSLLKNIYLAYRDYPAFTPFNYSFTAPEGEIRCWFDQNQMEKAFHSLLHNALKYITNQTSIEILIEDDNEYVIIKIIDAGTGFNKKYFEKIINQTEEPTYTGIDQPFPDDITTGLLLAKDIIQKHHGHIQVESMTEYGSIFIIRLKKGNEHFSQDELDCEHHHNIIGTTTDSPPIKNSLTLHFNDEINTSPNDNPNKNFRIVIIEDDTELLLILQELFSPLYQVSLASTGKEGMEIVKKELPDMVVSEVVLPGMTGIEMCYKIKNDPELCHIPVVLLTGQGEADKIIEGLQGGADDYIVKPFNTKVLLARCNNLIRNRNILKEKYSQLHDDKPQVIPLNPNDQRLLDAVNDIIEKNINNESFDMSIMANELALSRSSLYSRFKALTGKTPNDYMLNYRLKRGIELLIKHPELRVTDIASQLGFGSPRYFTRCFKSRYGVSPSEYRQKYSSQ